MPTFPQRSTARLTLRQVTEEDIPDLIRYVNHPRILANILNFPSPYLETDARARLDFVVQGFEKEERYVFAIASQEDNRFMGEIGLHLDKAHNRAEMGFWIGKPFWNQGLMKEAVAEVLKFGFEELRLHKIIATHFLDNPTSGKVLIGNGMIKEAEMKDHYLHQGVYGSIVQYRLTQDEFTGLEKG